MRSLLSGSIATLAIASLVSAQESISDLVAKLRLAPTEVDRINILSDEDFVFDFLSSTTGVVTGAGGRTVAATSENFPALVAHGVAMTVGFLGPCSINTPHTHPRATEINLAINGTFRTGLLVENGARFITDEAQPGMVSVFPQGAIHFEQNIGCEPAMFVAAFNNEDPGVSQVAQRFFGLPPDIVGSALGGLGVEQVAGLEALIPNNIAIGTEECLKRCGITPPATQPTSQRQPRVSGNALPASISSLSLPAPAAATPDAAPAKVAIGSGKSANEDDVTGFSQKDSNNESSTGNSSSGNGNNHNNDLLIALLAINGVLALGIVAGLIVFVRSRSNRTTSPPAIHRYERTANTIPKSEFDAEHDTGYYDPYPQTAAIPTLPYHDRTPSLSRPLTPRTPRTPLPEVVQTPPPDQ